MPLEGDSKFKNLKKAYAKGTELRGKTLGVIGFGRIGQATAKMALGLGMKVIAFDPFLEKTHSLYPFTTVKQSILKLKLFLKKRF